MSEERLKEIKDSIDFQYNLTPEQLTGVENA